MKLSALRISTEDIPQCGLLLTMMAATVGQQSLIRRAFEIATATASQHSTGLKGYPVATSKKKRACVVTYRHSGEQLFEKSLPPHANVNIL
jgi:hypothetical protein